KLVKAGFEKVFWLDGGVAAWQQADLPLVKGRN
ncbi:MAG: rhodanese-like domain-containing protein, partial [Arenimonas sp.]